MSRSAVARTALVAASCLFIGGAPAPAAEVVLEPVRDNSIFSIDQENSNGAGDSVFTGRAGNFGGGVVQRALIAFDVAGAVPPGSDITSVELTMTLFMASPQGGPAVSSLHRVLAGWGEGTSIAFGGGGVPATTDDATWLHTFFPGQFWASPGGDFLAAESGSTVIGQTQDPYTWGSTPQMVADVQAWLDDPGQAYGWLIRGDETALFSAKRLWSREAEVASNRPKLTIQFDAPCPGDIDGNGDVGFDDLLAILAFWGPCTDCPQDITGDGLVGFDDLLVVLSTWGPCP